MRYHHAHIVRNGRTLFQIDTDTAAPGEPFLIGLPQNRTEELLIDALGERGVTVQFGRHVTGVTTDDQAATVTYANGAKETYDWIIGADGVHSVTRDSLGIPFTGYNIPGEWSIADVDLASGFDGTTVHAWLFPEKNDARDAVLMLPIAENRVRLISSTPDALAALPIELDIAHVNRSGTFTIPVKQAARYVEGRVLLAGDAAHAHSPVGGRGMNLGIDDAVAAVKAITSGDTTTYNHTRIALGKHVIKSTETIRLLLLSRNPLKGALLRTAGFILSHVPFAQRQFVKRVSRF